MSERDAGFLARWSRLKHRSREQGEAGSGDASDAAVPPGGPPVADAAPDADRHPVRPQASSAADPASALSATDSASASSAAGSASASPAANPASVPPGASDRVADPAAAEAALPPVESLTPESDFRPFMRAGTDSATRNAALKRLFADPQFNVMDGLDVYIDDYGKTEPIPPPLLARLIEAHAPGLSGELTGDLAESLAGRNDDRAADALSDAQRVATAQAPAAHGAGTAAADGREAQTREVRGGEAPQTCETPATDDPAAHASGPSIDTDPCSKLHRY
ncbi:MAG: DUF3306 domain-containing protein [Burkholderiaceae bacterium]|nr:DUF3306 domain-containing protein [Burkholderiaceae bacterium]